MTKILFITLSNIGDVVLTLPALDTIREYFPQARISVMVGPRPKDFFKDNPYIDKLIIYDKHARLRDKFRLFNQLKKENFNLVVDLRNSLFGAFLPARYRISPFFRVPKDATHMLKRHICKVEDLFRRMKARKPFESQESSLFIPLEDKIYIKDILTQNNITKGEKVVVVSAGAKSHIKRWPKEKFAELIDCLARELKVRIILVGDSEDQAITKHIARNCRYPFLDLAGKTNVKQLAYLFKRADLLITNDSACLHLASYVNIPVLAIFGPTDELKYGPWSDNSTLAKKEIFCRPCQKAQCRFKNLACMQLVKVREVFRQAEGLLLLGHSPKHNAPSDKFKRILIVRTDRIGDVLLSTPVIKALRDNYPQAYIAMMVGLYAKEIVDGNPYLDEVIIYDKNGKHKSWQRSFRFALNLKKRKFDLAFILHPTNRAHLVTFIAGIPKRIGYDRKMGFLLTDRIKHTKQLGEKHELEYTLDLVRYLGIEPEDKNLFIPLKKEAREWTEEALRGQGFNREDKILAIHPAASCPSKIWPSERFAQVADRLAEKYAFKVLIIAGPKDMARARAVIEHMRQPAVNLAGKTSVSQLASVLKRSSLFISNDSGPVHIASAVGTPVISIFGRKQEGLGPKRWGPLGEKDKFLHKDVGCIKCLAHNCAREFACLKAITVDDILNLVDLTLKL